MTRLLASLLVAAAFTAVGIAQDTKSAPATGNAARGKVAFMSAGCYTCHGTVGQGGAGARLAPKPRAEAGFVAYVRSGRRGWSVAGGMPAYPPNVVSDAVLADIYAYLASIPVPQPVADNPLLKD